MEILQKIALTQENVGDWGLEETKDGGLSSVGMLGLASVGLEQTLTSPGGKEKAWFLYQIFPDADCAREACLYHLCTIAPVFSWADSDLREAIGLRKKDLCLRDDRSQTVFVQSERLLLVGKPGWVRMVLKRWYACEPEEVLPPEDKKTLEITLGGEDWKAKTSYPIVVPDKLADGTQPALIRLVITAANGEDITSRTGMKQTGGFSNEKLDTSNFFGIPNPCEFSGTAPSYVYFSHPGRLVVRCYHFDESGKLLAWGEVEVDVKIAPAAK
ncbi:MAG: hypothetical protein Q4D62_16365 [Planctomycetia bacterium]|nr:hypothetical protein [Planctomycetia bacterium]